MHTPLSTHTLSLSDKHTTAHTYTNMHKLPSKSPHTPVQNMQRQIGDPTPPTNGRANTLQSHVSPTPWNRSRSPISNPNNLTTRNCCINIA